MKTNILPFKFKKEKEKLKVKRKFMLEDSP